MPNSVFAYFWGSHMDIAHVEVTTISYVLKALMWLDSWLAANERSTDVLI